MCVCANIDVCEKWLMIEQNNNNNDNNKYSETVRTPSHPNTKFKITRHAHISIEWQVVSSPWKSSGHLKNNKNRKFTVWWGNHFKFYFYLFVANDGRKQNPFIEVVKLIAIYWTSTIYVLIPPCIDGARKKESIDWIVLHHTEVRDTHSRSLRTEKTESDSIQFILETFDFASSRFSHFICGNVFVHPEQDMNENTSKNGVMCHWVY